MTIESSITGLFSAFAAARSLHQDRSKQLNQAALLKYQHTFRVVLHLYRLKFPILLPTFSNPPAQFFISCRLNPVYCYAGNHPPMAFNGAPPQARANTKQNRNEAIAKKNNQGTLI